MHKLNPDKMPTQKSGIGHILPLANNLFPIDSCWERENEFSQME